MEGQENLSGGRSSYPPSFIPMRTWPWQQNSREGSKPLRLDAIGFIQRQCDERGASQQNPECNWSAWWSPNHGEETETQMAWPNLKSLWHGEDNSADGERSKKERHTEEDMGRYLQRMDNNVVWRLPEGSGRQDGKVLLQRHLWCPDDSQG